jgi:hypothetical protein
VNRSLIGLIEERTAQAVLLILILAVVTITTRLGSSRNLTPRKISGLDTFEEEIKKAVQLKRPVFFCPGLGDIGMPDTLAALAVLRKVARSCADNDVPIIVANADFNVQQVTEEIVKEAYTAAGKSQAYKPEYVRYISGRQFAFAAGVIGILARERPAVNFFLGEYTAEALAIAEAGRSISPVQLGGTTNTDQLPFFVATCDYVLLGEEMYAARAYLEKDPEGIAGLLGQDLGKFLAVLLILIATVTLTMGIRAFYNLLFL